MTCEYDSTTIGTIVIINGCTTTCYECNYHGPLPDGTVAKYIGHFPESGVIISKLDIIQPKMNCPGCGKEIFQLQLICDGGLLAKVFTERRVEKDEEIGISGDADRERREL